MAKQLVVIGNRIVAHGEDCFADIGGAVICKTDGKAYAGASIVECSTDCPEDIDEVGYEYHAGVFVPCAPYWKGDGTGYFMEICPDCATPRNSGIPIKDINWGKIASVSVNTGVGAEISFPITPELLSQYSMLRYKIKTGSVWGFGSLDKGEHTIISVGEFGVFVLNTNIEVWSEVTGEEIKIDKDIVIPFYLVSGGALEINVTKDPAAYSDAFMWDVDNRWYSANGTEVDPTQITLYRLGGSANGINTTANVVIDLEGRK